MVQGNGQKFGTGLLGFAGMLGSSSNGKSLLIIFLAKTDKNWRGMKDCT